MSPRSSAVATPIGGFIGLEPTLGAAGAWHASEFTLSTARAAFRLILETVRPTRVLIPAYICEVMYQPLRSMAIPWSTYPVSRFLSAYPVPAPAADELLLVVNYFGLHGPEMQALARAHGERLVVDNTQAFFETGYPKAWSFNSARKFLGVPDGAYLYAPLPVVPPLGRAQVGTRHLELRAAGDLGRARLEFLEHERRLGAQILNAGVDSRELLSRIDYPKIAARRRTNFARLHHGLAEHNALELPELADAVPHSYPFLCRRPVDRTRLHRRGIFVPTFWPELLDGQGTASTLATRLLPLPIDQRYGDPEMRDVVRAVVDLQAGR